MIHPSAIIHPKARVHASVRVGPYAVIEEDVEVGAGCIIGPHVFLTGRTKIGERNHFFAGCVIGEAPQDLKYRNEPTDLIIGNGNVFREHVTVHRSSKAGEATIVGSDSFFMASSHVGHNSTVGNSVILANGALLGGYAIVGDRAFISATAMVHQFCRVGTLALMQGGAILTMDLAPFTVLHNLNEVCGLNTIGLRRAGVPSEERLDLKRLYHALFRSGKNLRQALAEAKEKFSSDSARTMLEFIDTTKRGVCRDWRGKEAQEISE